jgi:hypothetical protein
LDDSNLAKVLNLAVEHGISHWGLGFPQLELDQRYETYFYPCVRWLEAEGLIRVAAYDRTMGGLANGSVRDISLTSRGMAVLGHNVTIDGNSTTVAAQVKEQAEGTVSSAGVGDPIGGILGGFTKSILGR